MYNLKHHKTLTLDKWSNYSKGQQILMIANELNRAKNLLKSNSVTEVKLCYERAFELTDLTSSDKKWRGRSRELRRFREMLGHLYLADKPDPILNLNLQDTLIKMNSEAYNMLHS